MTAGASRTAVATVLGVHYKTVARWVREARTPGGVDAKPQYRPALGLSDADLRKLESLLAKGAKAHVWHNQLWTAARVARLIDRHFGICYYPESFMSGLKRTTKSALTARKNNTLDAEASLRVLAYSIRR